MSNPLILLPARARQAIYIVYGVLSLVAIGVTAYYTALPELAIPDPVVGSLAVLGALAGPFGVLAASNTPTEDRNLVVGGSDNFPGVEGV